MSREPISLSDIKSLDFLAEDVLHEMRFSGYCYDENGNHLFPTGDKLAALATEYWDEIENNILEFRKCTIFKEFSMLDFCKLTVEDIQETYLSDILPKACAIMRKYAHIFVGAELSPEISDEYLKDLFIIRWRDNAMLWIARFGKPDPTFEEMEADE